MALSQEEVCDILFQPLDTSEHEVRFIHLHPAVAFDDPIVCSLDRVSLKQNVFFTAISWCWGVPDQKGQIIINGHAWAITSNLETALRYLRYQHKSRALWIDALCVNQSTRNKALIERNHQIQLMKLIFSKAPQVCIWLGVPNPKLKIFVEETVLSDGFNVEPRQVANYTARGIIDLLSLPWWSRLWVVQEGTLGSKVEIQLADARFIFHYLLDDINTFQKSSSGKVDDDLYYQLEEKVQNIDIFLRLRNQHTRASDIRQSIYNTSASSNQSASRTDEQLVSQFPKTLDLVKSGRAVPDTLLDLLVCCRSRQASDAHDKVYGLLGLLDPQAAAALKPDYSEPVHVMFVRLVRYFIHQDLLSFLTHASPSIRSLEAQSLPTWAPDWSVTSTELLNTGSPFKYLDRVFTRESVEISAWLARLLQTASQPSIFLPPPDIYAHGYVLNTPGVLIDIVSKCSKILPSIQNHDDWDSHLTEWQTRLCDEVFPPEHKISSPRSRATQMTPPFLNEIVSYHPRTKNGGVNFNWQQAAKIQADITRASVETATIQAYWNCVSHGVFDTRDDTPNIWNVFERQPLGHLMAKATRNRRLFCTTNRHLGNGPPNMKEGDFVFYFPGLWSACLLRSVPDHPGFYTYVGECYLELFRKGDNLNSSTQTAAEAEAEKIFQARKTIADVVTAKSFLWLAKYSNVQAIAEIYIV